MQTDCCLNVCLIGDSGIGQSSFVRCYRGIARAASSNETFSIDGKPFETLAKVESVVALIEVEGKPCRVRLIEGLGGPLFEQQRNAALCTAHAIIVCFAADSVTSLQSAEERWIPAVLDSGTKAPWFMVGLRSDLREKDPASKREGHQFVSLAAATMLSEKLGGHGALDTSAWFPETVQQVFDEALSVAKNFYELQWQLTDEGTMDSKRHDSSDPQWLLHERLNVPDDVKQLTEDEVRQGLSMLGDTGSRQHAYLRCDIPGLDLTSVNKIRPWVQLQFLNLSHNNLRTLEPLGDLRNLVHLNASHNLLIRGECFAPPEGLETVDMSYNLIAELGDWKVHRFLRELNLRGNYITKLGPGLTGNKELRMLDLSENAILRLEHLDGLGLRTLNVSQNKLKSLEAIACLPDLQVLDARHNFITSTAGLSAEASPRLRKLRLSENRIHRIAEVSTLADFSFLSDLNIEANPVTELPYFRAQVIHSLPRLRSLDNQAVTPEERVKTTVIFGADVETRREMFEELLPEETFVDRRLVTAEGIADLELQEFGQNGDVGPFGKQEASMTFGKPSTRTKWQQASLRQRIYIARAGGSPKGVADFLNYDAPFLTVFVDSSEIREVLEACVEGEIHSLLLGPATLSTEAVRAIVALFKGEGSILRHVDLTNCSTVASLGAELLSNVPLHKRCSIEADGCGLAESTVAKLRNAQSLPPSKEDTGSNFTGSSES